MSSMFRAHFTSAISMVALATFAQVTPTAGAERPRLVVLIVVDQLRGDYLTRFGDLFGEGGFKRLASRGAWFTNAHFSYGATLTGPGHATVSTGRNPSSHGIVGNGWYGPDRKDSVYCVEDSGCPLVGAGQSGTASGRSPRLMVGPTLGDRLKEKLGNSAKVWSCGLKDRASILIAGHRADRAIWWSTQTGDFVSSSYYGATLPDWCRAMNKERYADSFFKAVWERALPKDAYTRCSPDDVDYEAAGSSGIANTLPKTIGGKSKGPDRSYYNSLFGSPFGNDLVLEVARRMVVNESLGDDEITDLLCLILSSNDSVGHSFGPDSHEVLDMTVRTDRQLAAWLEFLDKRIGLDRCFIALTADHGVGPAAELTIRRGQGGGRISQIEILGELNRALRAAFAITNEEVELIRAVEFPWIYVNLPVVKARGLEKSRVIEATARVVREHEGVEAAIIPSKIAAMPKQTVTPWERSAQQSYYTGRSGDVYVHVKRNWNASSMCATHGTFHPYDTHVPLMLMGKGIRPGRYDMRVDPRDLAVTLCEILGLELPPKPAGRVLSVALAD